MAKTKTVDGKELTADKFAMVLDPEDPSKWHLPVDGDHIDSALKMFGHETHGSSEDRAKAAHKIASAARTEGVDNDRVKDFESKYCKSDDHAEQHDYTGGWIEIFRAGDYSNQGKAKVSHDDLVRVVNDYDPDYHEAPVCIGHPADNLPAYAWVDRLKLDGDVLLAKEKQVDPEFADMRKAGRFKKRSAAFYRDADGNIAGLRHVGWLGAQPPAVKGLKNFSFNDGDREFVEIEFAQEENVPGDEKSVKDQIKEFFAEMFGGKRETATFSEAEVQSIATKAAEAATKPLQTEITSLKTQLADQGTKFAEREKALAGGEVKQRSVEAVNKLKGAGKWIPAFDKMGLPLVFGELAKIDTTVEFGEADKEGKKPQVAPLQILLSFMEGLPKIVPTERYVDPKTGAERKPGQTRYTEGKGVQADSNSVALNDQAKARAKEKNISFSEALDQIVEEHPELTQPGGSQAGAV